MTLASCCLQAMMGMSSYGTSSEAPKPCIYFNMVEYPNVLSVLFTEFKHPQLYYCINHKTCQKNLLFLW